MGVMSHSSCQLTKKLFIITGLNIGECGYRTDGTSKNPVIPLVSNHTSPWTKSVLQYLQQRSRLSRMFLLWSFSSEISWLLGFPKRHWSQYSQRHPRHKNAQNPTDQNQGFFHSRNSPAQGLIHSGEVEAENWRLLEYLLECTCWWSCTIAIHISATDCWKGNSMTKILMTDYQYNNCILKKKVIATINFKR